jgi:hypothetical protein
MPTSVHTRLRRTAAVMIVPAMLAAACSSSTKTGVASSTGSPSAATKAVPCPGAPIRLTTVASLSGAVSTPNAATDFSQATRAAVAAVNAKCEAGRPLAVTVCDDQSDPNQSSTCGTAAKQDGSIALLGSLGVSDNSATASGLPVILTRNATPFELASPKAYSGTSYIALGLGFGSAVAAAGVKNVVAAAFETPSASAFEAMYKTVWKADFGVDATFVNVPANTTDFTSVAAQLVSMHPSAIGVVLPAVVPFLNALNAEGITPATVPTFSDIDLTPPSVIQQLGQKLNGMYLLTDVVPPSDTKNAGIQQMLAEYQSAGIRSSPANMSVSAVQQWSDIHIVAQTIGQMDAAARNSVSGQSLAAALVARGEITSPARAPFDMAMPAFPTIPALAHLRIFSNQAMLVQVQQGVAAPVSGFFDIMHPIKIQARG